MYAITLWTVKSYLFCVLTPVFFMPGLDVIIYIIFVCTYRNLSQVWPSSGILHADSDQISWWTYDNILQMLPRPMWTSLERLRSSNGSWCQPGVSVPQTSLALTLSQPWVLSAYIFGSFRNYLSDLVYCALTRSQPEETFSSFVFEMLPCSSTIIKRSTHKSLTHFQNDHNNY